MFEFNDTHEVIESTLRKFCREEIEPHCAALERGEISPFEPLRKLSATFQLNELVGGPLREKAQRLRAGEPGRRAGRDGAAGLLGDPAVSAIFAKEVAAVSPGLCLSLVANFGCGATIAARGDADLIERVAVPVLSLEKVGCWGLTEAASGSDAFAMQTRVREQGDEVVLNGSKTFISNAPIADFFLIYARFEGADEPAGERDKRRIFPVVVERGRAGLETGPPMEKFGMHASPTGEIFLNEVRVPRSHLLGDPAAPARDHAEETLATERAAVVAMCLGVIERCLDEATRFAIERKQFGHPIASYQLIQQKLAKMVVARENVRNLVFKLIWLQQQGKGSEQEVSAAKWYASETACEVALDAMQVMGGSGYMREFPPERLFRDIRLWTVGGGTSEIQQLTIAKGHLRDHGFSIDLCGGYGE
jgi:alkylation response protein AidB-like acyl-CoA dehydrogenase